MNSHANTAGVSRSGLRLVAAATRKVRRTSKAPDPEDVADATESTVVSNGNGSRSATEQEARRKALEGAMKNINSKFGAGSVMYLGQRLNMRVQVTPSGALTLDKAMGGGYPVGRIIEVFGPESSGKTTLAMHAIAEVQRRGGNCAFIDAEHAFDQEYAKRLGIDSGNLIVSQPDYGEQALQIMDDLIRTHSVDLIVVDSVSALAPRSEVEGDIGTPQVGGQARLMSMALRKVAANASKCQCTIVFINQLRYKVGVVYGSPETTSGGNALKFYATVRLDIRAKEKLTEPGGTEPIGTRVKVKVVKNKVAPPFDVAEFDIIFGEGINSVGCVLDAAVDMGVVEKRTSHYLLGEQRLGQGRDRVVQALKEDPPLLARIEEQVRTRISAMRGSSSNGNSNGNGGSVDGGEYGGFGDDVEAGLEGLDDVDLRELEEMERGRNGGGYHGED